jgi:selenocysteine-specific elongation factor
VLVVAADEGVMPQTREHLAILDLLAVPASVVALTKIDLVEDREWLELVQLDVVEALRPTRFAEATIVPVSAVTGEGMAALRRQLAFALGQLTPRRNRARPRLPIDRVFSLSGFGTVVTGTLSDGNLSVGDAVEVLPAGKQARVRSLQMYKQPIEQGRPGSRLAINLSGIATDDIHRGDVVVKAGALQTTRLIDVHFRLLAEAAKPLVHNQRVDFFCGAAEIPAVVRLLGAETLEPGHEGWLQLRLERPTVVVSGDRYILRQPTPSITLGGGVVLAPHPHRRWRRFDPAVIARLQTLASGAPDEILLQALMRRPFLTAKELMAQSELDLQVALEALTALQATGAVHSFDAAPEAWLFTVETGQQIDEHIYGLLAAFHHQTPLRRGMPRSEVRSRLQGAFARLDLSVRLFNAIVERMQDQNRIEADDRWVWLYGFRVKRTLHQQSMADHVLDTFAQAPFAPPNVQETLRMLGGDLELLESLLEHDALVRIGGDILFRPGDFEAMVQAVQTYMREQGSITLAEARDLLQTSRKYVQALLEEMDARRITRRQGDGRTLREVIG